MLEYIMQYVAIAIIVVGIPVGSIVVAIVASNNMFPNRKD